MYESMDNYVTWHHLPRYLSVINMMPCFFFFDLKWHKVSLSFQAFARYPLQLINLGLCFVTVRVSELRIIYFYMYKLTIYYHASRLEIAPRSGLLLVDGVSCDVAHVKHFLCSRIFVNGRI